MLVAALGDQYFQTMDKASYGGNIFYLQMAGGAIWWCQVMVNLVLEITQVKDSISGSVVPLAMFPKVKR